MERLNGEYVDIMYIHMCICIYVNVCVSKYICVCGWVYVCVFGSLFSLVTELGLLEMNGCLWDPAHTFLVLRVLLLRPSWLKLSSLNRCSQISALSSLCL